MAAVTHAVTHKDIYTLSSPADERNALPLVFDSPHSGRLYPADFRHDCDMPSLRRAEDNCVDLLFENVPSFGAGFLAAHFPRTYIDANRAETDIDPDLLLDSWPYAQEPTARSHAGIGLVRRVLRPGVPVYDRKLSAAEILHRITHYYRPYHAALKEVIDRNHYCYGSVWHINCHSMPSLSAHPQSLQRPSVTTLTRQADFVLGDRDGTSCAHSFTRALRDFIKEMGYSVAINQPYRGVELVRKFGDPARGRHSIQIEINKALYWNEEKIEFARSAPAFKADIERIAAFCADYVRQSLRTATQAAD